MVQQTDGSPEHQGIRGPIVILGIFGSVVLITVIAVAAYFLTKTPNLLCDSGDASLNPTDSAGIIQPLTRTFDTIGGAESFICHSIQYPRDLQGLQPDTISAERDGNLGDVVEGNVDAIVTLTYADSSSKLTFEVSPFPIDAPAGGSPTPLIVDGKDGKIIETPGTQTVWWTNGPLFFQATATGLDRPTLLKILDSVN